MGSSEHQKEGALAGRQQRPSVREKCEDISFVAEIQSEIDEPYASSFQDVGSSIVGRRETDPLLQIKHRRVRAHHQKDKIPKSLSVLLFVEVFSGSGVLGASFAALGFSSGEHSTIPSAFF